MWLAPLQPIERIIAAVEAKEDMSLIATFLDGEVVRFDLETIIPKHPEFEKLRNQDLFKAVRIDGLGYGISWNDELDLSSEGIYDQGEHVAKTDPDIRTLFGQAVARPKA